MELRDSRIIHRPLLPARGMMARSGRGGASGGSGAVAREGRHHGGAG